MWARSCESVSLSLYVCISLVAIVICKPFGRSAFWQTVKQTSLFLIMILLIQPNVTCFYVVYNVNTEHWTVDKHSSFHMMICCMHKQTYIKSKFNWETLTCEQVNQRTNDFDGGWRFRFFPSFFSTSSPVDFAIFHIRLTFNNIFILPFASITAHIMH